MQSRDENVKNMTDFEFSSWSDHLEIFDFPHLCAKFLPSNGSKTFYALFDHDEAHKNGEAEDVVCFAQNRVFDFPVSKS